MERNEEIRAFNIILDEEETSKLCATTGETKPEKAIPIRINQLLAENFQELEEIGTSDAFQGTYKGLPILIQVG